MMKKILVIAPSSFPVYDAECIVNIKLIQALLQSGEFSIDLISKKNKNQDYPSDTLDSLQLHFSNYVCVEVDNKKTNPIVLWQNFMALIKFGVAFKGCHWAYPALIEAERLIKENKYDYVLTKSGSSFLVGMYLKQKYGIKWVATWNDPCPVANYPAPYGKGGDYRDYTVTSIIRCMQQADIHVFPSERLMNYMNGYLHIGNRSKLVVVPHIIYPQPLAEKPSGTVMRMLHAGNLKNPRSPRTFLEGVRMALNKVHEIKFSINILGVMSDVDKDYINTCGLSEYINYLAPVPYMESLEIAKDYDLSLIIEANCKEGIFLPTKVGDSMQANLITMAISPSVGVLNDLYNEGYIRYFADVTSPQSICDELLKAYSDFKNGKFIRKQNYKKEYLPEYIVRQYLAF